jgi:hypothetical protein
MSPKLKALNEIEGGKIKPEPFRVEIRIKKEKLDPKRFKIKKDGKEIDMSPPKGTEDDWVFNRIKKFMEET